MDCGELDEGEKYYQRDRKHEAKAHLAFMSRSARISIKCRLGFHSRNREISSRNNQYLRLLAFDTYRFLYRFGSCLGWLQPESLSDE